MTATSLPEGTDSIIEDSAVRASGDDDAPGFGATGGSNLREPATGGAVGKPSDAGKDATSAKPAGDAAPAEAPTLDDAKRAAGEVKAKVGDAASGLKDQAADRAREYAVIGKDKASEALHNVAKLMDDAAGTVDDKVGAQYGDYARQASGYVRTFATGLDEKDVDQLFAEGREFVQKSPGIAIGIAAAAGFALTRVLKAGLDAGAAGKGADS